MKPDVFLRALRDAGVEIGRPVSPAERKRWKGPRLPNDLLGFLRKANGLRLGEVRLLPLREIRPATEVLFQDQDSEEDALPDTWLALTDDVEEPLMLDVVARVYRTLDDEIGGTWEEALDWLYARYL